MAGIYLHIPFCKRTCTYCNFHFSTSMKQKERMLESMKQELSRRKKEHLVIETIYLGGGTPSLLNQEEVKDFLKLIHTLFDVHKDAEITMEMNPDDCDVASLQGLHELSFNRISLGIQSFQTSDLEYMDRIHDVDQAHRSIQNCRAAGFDNLSIDLIYGTPGLSNRAWEENLQLAANYDIEHLSCYQLTVEARTPLHALIAKQQKEAPDEQAYVEQFEILMDFAEQQGYEHYEISNFCKPGFESKHNSAYWQNKPYIGIGPSAHSYDGQDRSWNIANNSKYIRGIEAHAPIYEVEQLSPTDRFNEFVLIQLRQAAGLNKQKLQTEFVEFYPGILANARKYIEDGKLIETPTHIYLSRAGKLWADAISLDFFVE